MANLAFMELCNKVYNQTATVEELGEFQEAMKVIASKGASPQAIWELNQIIVKQANDVLMPKLNFLEYISEVQHVGHGQKIQYQRNKGKMKMKWTARGTGVDYTRVGRQEKFTAEPVKIAGGVYYEYDALLSGSTEGFTRTVNLLVEDMEKKIMEKAISTLHTAMASAPSANLKSGANVTLQDFDSVASTIQRYNPNVTCVCDIDFAKKLTALVGDSAMSDAMKNTKNQNGLFTTINGVNIVTFVNPFEDYTNTKLVAPRNYAYIVPAGTDKPLKIGFEGDMYQMTEQDLDTERVFLKVGQKVAVDVFDVYYIGEINETTLA